MPRSREGPRHRAPTRGRLLVAHDESGDTTHAGNFDHSISRLTGRVPHRIWNRCTWSCCSQFCPKTCGHRASSGSRSSTWLQLNVMSTTRRWETLRGRQRWNRAWELDPAAGYVALSGTGTTDADNGHIYGPPRALGMAPQSHADVSFHQTRSLTSGTREAASKTTPSNTACEHLPPL